ncbi:pseudouridine synthase [Coralloluteibacterium stylophorae]|uniref:Pseudouridine synthase n=1 Tax=Coralloluteibacterium stylophorae TaxID=1776034 RepID=A0A8J7VWI9_9GAMM|nr:pseudouridine synthase [Coralloluteibacterium stylophorae]MBS7457538.1 pseudouridine synthase [Coralloluteibacterium stylophorae]
MTQKSSSDASRRVLSLNRESTSAGAERLEERLHKVLAQAGLGSRRALEQRIGDGLVKVNGETAQIGQSVRGGDRIEIDGRTFVATALTDAPRVLVYNKPEGEVTTRDDPEGRPTVFDALPPIKGARWIAVGRLDINTTGLLLLTTDGELANALMHPSHEVEREYVCRVRSPEGVDDAVVPPEVIRRLTQGVELEDGPAKFEVVEPIGTSESHAWLRVVVAEGRNREVRRLWESQGYQVSRLKRVRYGTVTLPRPLLRGRSEELPEAEIKALRQSLGLEDTTPALTLQPVIGQRRARVEIQTGGREKQNSYLNGHVDDEAREFRRFDNLREDTSGRRGRPGGKRGGGGRGGKGGDDNRGNTLRGGNQGPSPYTALTVSGDAAARGGPVRRGKPRRQGGGEANGNVGGPGASNPAAFRTWYVPEGVDTGPSGHRNPGARGPKRGPGGPGGGKPRGAGGQGTPYGKPGGQARGPGGPRGGRPGGGGPKPGGNRGGGPRRGGGGGGGPRGSGGGNRGG